jgi:hypothetical protein
VSGAATQRDRIVDLADRPEGVSSAELQEIMGLAAGVVPVNMQALEYQGRVLRAKADGHRLRWFVSAVHRAAWMEQMRVERVAVLQAQHEAQKERNRAREVARTAARRAEKESKPAKPPKSAKRLQKKAGPAALTTYTAGSSKTAPRIHSGPVDYSRAKYTIDDKPRAVAAWQNQSSQPPVGFASLGPGRYFA